MCIGRQLVFDNMPVSLTRDETFTRLLTHAQFDSDDIERHCAICDAAERRRTTDHWHTMFASTTTMINV